MDIAPTTKRDKILLYAVLMLAFIVLYVRFLLIPGIGSLQQARADLTEAQDAQITMQETILQAGVNAADKNTAWGELQTANARYYSILTSDELDTLVTGLELNHSMQPVSLSIGQPLTQSMTGYIAGTQAGQSPAPAGSAAAAVTVLNTEPGVKVEERKRFMYTPSYRSSPSSISGGSAGSKAGAETMQRISPVL